MMLSKRKGSFPWSRQLQTQQNSVEASAFGESVFFSPREWHNDLFTVFSITFCTATQMQSFSTTKAPKPWFQKFSEKGAQEQILQMKVQIQVLQLQELTVACSRDWREIRDVQRTPKLAGFQKRNHKKIGRTEDQPRDQTCWYIHTGIRKCLKPLIRGERDPQLQSSQTFPGRKRQLLMSGGTNSSTRCSNLAQEASRRC